MLTKDNTVILACTSMLLHVEAAQKKMKTDFPVIEADREYHVDPQSMKQCLRNKLTELPDSVENVLAAMACCGGSWDGIRAERKQENADLVRCILDYVPGSNRILEKLVSGRWDGQFVVKMPGDTVKKEDFTRGMEEEMAFAALF